MVAPKSNVASLRKTFQMYNNNICLEKYLNYINKYSKIKIINLKSKFRFKLYSPMLTSSPLLWWGHEKHEYNQFKFYLDKCK